MSSPHDSRQADHAHVVPPAGTAVPPASRPARRLAVALGLLIVAIAAFWLVVLRDTGRVFHIAPHGTAGAGGSSWEAAGTLADLPRFVERAAPGDQVWIRGDAGAYHTTDAIVIAAGGSAEAPVTVRGVATDGSDTATPTFVGARTAPYDPDGNPGKELFKLLGGADHLEFRNLAFANQGNGAFRVGAAINDLTIEDVRAENVRRFFETNRSGDARSATISGLRMRDVTVAGFSKGAIRLRDDTHDVVITDVVGDSQRQDGDSFAIGVHLDGTVHDVLFERVVMRNSHDTTSRYWNGDGFAAERGTYDLRFVDTVATGSTDAGYDLKSSATELVHAVAEDNKRNYRLWDRVDLVDSVGRDPHRRGGSGSQAQIWAGSNARVTITGGTLADRHSDTVVFEIDDTARVTVAGTTVTRAPDAAETVIASGAHLRVR